MRCVRGVMYRYIGAVKLWTLTAGNWFLREPPYANVATENRRKGEEDTAKKKKRRRKRRSVEKKGGKVHVFWRENLPEQEEILR